ncbi:MAG: 1,4-alpha-glucan branching protein GlgB [Acidimicrobiales bacterium]
MTPSVADYADLRALEDLARVSSTVTDGFGVERTATDDVRCAVLRELGHNVSQAGDAEAALERARSIEEARFLDPVLIAWDGAMEAPTRAPDGTGWTIRSVDSADLQDGAHRSATISGTSTGSVIDVEDLRPGFHMLELVGVGGEDQHRQALVIAAPPRAYRHRPGGRTWGVRVRADQRLAASARSTAIGEIEALARGAARQGAQILAIEERSVDDRSLRADLAARLDPLDLVLYAVAQLTPGEEAAEGVVAGLPPEPVFPDGQRFGPAKLTFASDRHEEHAAFRTEISQQMEHADWLEIEHVQRLSRQYCFLDDPTDGVTVHRPLEELLAVVCMLSHRYRCAVVGDDIGAADNVLARSLEARGVLRRHVAITSLFESPSATSVASITGAGLPQAEEWWNGDDIESLRERGVDADHVASLHRDREALRADLGGRANCRADLGSVPEPVLHQMIERLGHSESPLVLVDLEDIDHLDRARPVMETLDRSRREAQTSGTWPPAGWWFGADEQHLFNEGTHSRLWHALGARPDRVDGADGVRFSVWAPNASAVHVTGDHNGWSNDTTPMRRIGESGVWDTFVHGASSGIRYKYRITSSRGEISEKTDPMAFLFEQPPGNAAIVADLSYEWADAEWVRARSERNRWDRPMSIYEVHLGSWRRTADGHHLTYIEHVAALVEHVSAMGFTHVELLPITEHPLYASWGYQTTGYFAPTSRYGSPQELMALIDAFHSAGIGVILDWVPSHFPADGFALASFDGTHLYEHADPREGFHPDWKSSIFNYGRHEVRSFLVSSARFWLEVFHIDGLRVDAVASMLYRDYSRGDDWIPNRYGGRENLEAIEFLKHLNHELYSAHPDIVVIAEESTAWPGVTQPTDRGGLGFGFKWDMGWMNDTLDYFQHDPVHRRHHHQKLTFRAMYGFTENYVLPLSHDEVVHGKGSLLAKMPGSEWEKFANLRLLMGWQYATPGKKLLFMGSELAPMGEWNHDEGLPWHLADDPQHQGVLQWVAMLNRLHRDVPALHAADTQPEGFRWIDADNAAESLFSFVRSDGRDDSVVVVMNATPVPRHPATLGVPHAGDWEIVASSDDAEFGGTGSRGEEFVPSKPDGAHGFERSIELDLPGLSITFLRLTH